MSLSDMVDGTMFEARLDDLSIQILPQGVLPIFVSLAQGKGLPYGLLSSPWVAIDHWPPWQQTLLLAIILFPGITTMLAMGQWPSWYELMRKWRLEVVGPWEMWYCVCVVISWNQPILYRAVCEIAWSHACEAIAVCYYTWCSCWLTATPYH